MSCKLFGVKWEILSLPSFAFFFIFHPPVAVALILGGHGGSQGGPESLSALKILQL